MNNRVYGVECPDYSRTGESIERLIRLMGGPDRFVSPGARVILKPNLLQAAPPEKAVTTHPAVIEAAAAALRAAGADSLIAESPGAGYAYSERTLDRTYRITGTERAAAAAGVPLNRDLSATAVSFPEGRLIRRFEIISPVVEADAVISLAKLKTHAFTAMTGAVKNLFGVIPGRTKLGYHAHLQDPDRFAGMLLDLAARVRPRLTIMDAVIGMEGDGPAGGRPRRVGLLLAASNPLALDIAAAEIMGLPPADNPLLREAGRRGLSPAGMADIELIGIEPDKLRSPGYRLPSTLGGAGGLAGMPGFLRAPLSRLLSRGTTRIPHIDRGRCVACGACRDACPMGVISIIEHSHAEIEHSGCIRCFCCHEMCAYNAVELRAGRLFRLFNR